MASNFLSNVEIHLLIQAEQDTAWYILVNPKNRD